MIRACSSFAPSEPELLLPVFWTARCNGVEPVLFCFALSRLAPIRIGRDASSIERPSRFATSPSSWEAIARNSARSAPSSVPAPRSSVPVTQTDCPSRRLAVARVGGSYGGSSDLSGEPGWAHVKWR